MKKKQLALKNLKVKSFVTEQQLRTSKIKGGSYLCDTAADPFFCGGYDEGGGGSGASCYCPTLDQSCRNACSNLAGTCSCNNTCGCPVTAPPGCNTDFACTLGGC